MTIQGSNLQTAYNFFVNNGLSSNAAAGVASGLYAESGLNPLATNPTSGAQGIAQWLGSRLTGLVSEAGSTAGTLGSQLQYTLQELQGSGNGGAAVMNASSPQQALSNFITGFERPAAGSETTGDISRGTAALGSLNLTGSTTSPLDAALNNLQASGGLLGQSNTTIGNIAKSLAGTTVSQAASSAATAASTGLFAPLIAYFQGLGAEFTAWETKTLPSALERTAIGIVAIILIMAGVFFLAASNKTIVQTVKSGAKIAALAA